MSLRLDRARLEVVGCAALLEATTGGRVRRQARDDLRTAERSVALMIADDPDEQERLQVLAADGDADAARELRQASAVAHDAREIRLYAEENNPGSAMGRALASPTTNDHVLDVLREQLASAREHGEAFGPAWTAAVAEALAITGGPSEERTWRDALRATRTVWRGAYYRSGPTAGMETAVRVACDTLEPEHVDRFGAIA